ncbi:uncharacterized protein B0T23DRAFT_136408 [Neurospora hispaniola]|uniref:Secreted protein n=1 Tax=Neurospora hispaniola TaxID=588809 RepID=A0AAJ0MR29_9PEZI|nr:hypothetical protein B0T23DRAFT_136408 [Neurospora hispaniola]
MSCFLPAPALLLFCPTSLLPIDHRPFIGHFHHLVNSLQFIQFCRASPPFPHCSLRLNFSIALTLPLPSCLVQISGLQTCPTIPRLGLDSIRENKVPVVTLSRAAITWLILIHHLDHSPSKLETHSSCRP